MSSSRAYAPVVRPVALWVAFRTAVFVAVYLTAAHPAACLLPLAARASSPAFAVALVALAGAAFLASACALAARAAGPRACLPALAAADVALTASLLAGDALALVAMTVLALFALGVAPRVATVKYKIPAIPILLTSVAALAAGELFRADRGRPFAEMAAEIRRAHVAAFGKEPRTVGGNDAVALALSLHGLRVVPADADVVVWEDADEFDPSRIPADHLFFGRPFVVRSWGPSRRVGWLLQAPRGLVVGAKRSDNLQ